MCMGGMIMKNKKLRFVISSLVSGLGFYMFLSLPIESRYYGLLVGMVLVVISFWFGLGIFFEKNFNTRIMTVLLPILFFIGFGLFSVLLAGNFWLNLGLSLFFSLVAYLIFITENIFLVAIGFKTVPLYRAAYTMSLIITLFSAFFLFSSLSSFNLIYWMNMLVVFGLSAMIFWYQFWSIAIELPDDGKEKNRWAYVLVPSWLLSQLALVYSFWPVGLFRGSIYLVAMIYVISGLYQADLRERLFKRTWLTFIWIGIAVILGTVILTRWI